MYIIVRIVPYVIWSNNFVVVQKYVYCNYLRCVLTFTRDLVVQTSDARDLYHTSGYKSVPISPCLGPHHKVRLNYTKEFGPHSFHVRTTYGSSVVCTRYMHHKCRTCCECEAVT